MAARNTAAVVAGMKRKELQEKRAAQKHDEAREERARQAAHEYYENLVGDLGAPAEDEKQEDDWVYELVVQYLICPLWRVPISTFLDQTCGFFDLDPAYKHQRHDVHAKFKKLVEMLLKEMMAELGLNDDQFVSAVEKGLNKPAHRAIFEQLSLIDNYAAFKTLMGKRNTELDREAQAALESQDRRKKGKSTPMDREKERLRKEKEDLERAIAQSNAAERSRRVREAKEDDELQVAMKESMRSFENDEKRRQAEQTKKGGKPLPPVKDRAKKDDQPVIPSERSEYDLLTESRAESVREVEPEKKLEEQPIEALFKERENLLKRLEAMENQEQKEEKGSAVFTIETPEERKKRLKAQRDLIVKKKQEDMEEELRNYRLKHKKKGGEEENTQPGKKPLTAEEEQELQERQAVYSRFKQL